MSVNFERKLPSPEFFQIQMNKFVFAKAELLQEGIFFHPFICQRRFSNEKVGNRKN